LRAADPDGGVAGLSMVDLASMDQDGRGQGTKAAEALLSRIGGRHAARHILLEPRLAMRSSLGPAR
jgi:LacI family transcriptional regulator